MHLRLAEVTQSKIWNFSDGTDWSYGQITDWVMRHGTFGWGGSIHEIYGFTPPGTSLPSGYVQYGEGAPSLSL